MSVYLVELESIEYECNGEDTLSLPTMYTTKVCADTATEAYLRAVEKINDNTGSLVDGAVVVTLERIR